MNDSWGIPWSVFSETIIVVVYLLLNLFTMTSVKQILMSLSSPRRRRNGISSHNLVNRLVFFFVRILRHKVIASQASNASRASVVYLKPPQNAPSALVSRFCFAPKRFILRLLFPMIRHLRRKCLGLSRRLKCLNLDARQTLVLRSFHDQNFCLHRHLSFRFLAKCDFHDHCISFNLKVLRVFSLIYASSKASELQIFRKVQDFFSHREKLKCWRRMETRRGAQ